MHDKQIVRIKYKQKIAEIKHFHRSIEQFKLINF